MSARCCNCGRLRPRLVRGQCPTIEECQEWLRAKAEVERKPIDPITAITLGWRDVPCTSHASTDCRGEVRIYGTGPAKCVPCQRMEDGQRLEAMKVAEARQRSPRQAAHLRRLEEEADDEFDRLVDADDRERAATGRGPRRPDFVEARFRR